MLHFLAILVDDDLRQPLYADPAPDEIEPEHWQRVGELVLDLQDGEARAEGTEEVGDLVFGWRHVARNGLTFVAFAEDVETSDVKVFLKALVDHYFDEVDDVRRPEREGVADIVVDVIPPWEE